ncbi:2'-5' RNA ligase family protein [Marivirga arenosa]|uniref:2'-5' RNA ligase family protein n=1 Tax=Marivirga arenosa TaxID=3059076 RepID=A0AA49J9W2_9BACT|nr:2'-5' RNA ligase family protein [Marivirga sp. BKB1-2]WKK78842.1 2'-5' RNA ligase family protein [Marivirga sp. BKB1-2]
MEKQLYFIGICPPHPLEQDIHRIKEEFYQKYGIKGAFRSKAHITLQMPFHLADKKVTPLIKELEETLHFQKNFLVEIRNFNVFEPRVIYIDVMRNKKLEALQQMIEKFMKQYQVFNGTHKNRGFNPHITIAFRDLKKPTFYKIWNEVKDRKFQESFEVDSITVFKHNGNDWDNYKELKFGNAE